MKLALKGLVLQSLPSSDRRLLMLLFFESILSFFLPTNKFLFCLKTLKVPPKLSNLPLLCLNFLLKRSGVPNLVVSALRSEPKEVSHLQQLSS